jgi:hypothetical protein
MKTKAIQLACMGVSQWKPVHGEEREPARGMSGKATPGGLLARRMEANQKGMKLEVFPCTVSTD